MNRIGKKKIDLKQIPFKIHYRPGTSDENAIIEVVQGRAYHKPRFHFDVEEGEHWLDLGANIGSFAIYCRMRGAKATCYEPDPECFRLLKKNAPKFILHNAVVTSSREKSRTLFTNRNPDDHYRGTIIPVRGYVESVVAKNVYAGSLCSKKFDGVKMDIEGSETGILDEWLLPKCNKLVMEYHTSRDPDMRNFQRRIKMIKKHFKNVKYPVEFDRALERGEIIYRSFVDRLIFAWN